MSNPPGGHVARAYLDTLLFLQEEGVNESHGEGGEVEAESTFAIKPDDSVMQHTATSPAAAQPSRIAAAVGSTSRAATAPLNRIDMNIQGDKVYLSGLLDLAGLATLEKKIEALKVLLESNQADANDTTEEGAS